jgi:glycosyltransferase involved in cell wall biosynthesis
MRNALHIIRGLDPRAGGMTVSVPALARAVAETGSYRQRLIYFSGPREYAPPDVAGVELMRLPWRPLGAMFGQTRRDLSQVIAEIDIVHIHGIWQAHCAAAGAVCRQLRRPFMVSAHGMLQPWALRNKRWKKSPYSALVERRNLDRAACFRALTAAEIADYRAYGLQGPVAVIANGVDAPPGTGSETFFRAFPELEGKRLVLFLSRVHYKKGVDVLCRAWATMANNFPEARLVIAGPDYENTLARMQALMWRLRIETQMAYVGTLNGDQKWAALAACEGFALPSYSEGFSVAVLEALAAGRPVIITPGCNFPEAGEAGCGVLVKPSEEGLAAALRAMLERSPAENAAMGARGADLVRRRYSWPVIGRQLAEVYDWILDGGPKPEFVFLGSTHGSANGMKPQCAAS